MKKWRSKEKRVEFRVRWVRDVGLLYDVINNYFVNLLLRKEALFYFDFHTKHVKNYCLQDEEAYIEDFSSHISHNWVVSNCTSINKLTLSYIHP